MPRTTGLALIPLLLFVALATAADNYPQFLANRLQPPSDGQNLPDRWSTTENVLWKVDIPGLAWSSPIVWGDRVLVTTCNALGESREPRKGLYIQDVDATKYPKPSVEHEFKLYCLDLNSGNIIWEKLAHRGVPAKQHHIKNTLASETPATDGERVYAYFGNVGVFCYDLEGEPLWSHKVPVTDTVFSWGTASSPIVHADRVYIVNDNEDQSYILALNKHTGEVIWKMDRDEQSSWSTPFIWENELRTEIVTSATGKIRSYDLDGNELWNLSPMTMPCIPMPFAQYGNVYLTSGYIISQHKPVYVVRSGASGDISLKDGAKKNDYVAWSQAGAGPYHPTPLIYRDQYYVLLDRGFLTSYDAKTGQEIYGKQRIPKGRAFTSSPWAYDGKIFCLNEDGVTFVFKAGPEFELLGTNALAEDDMGMATPAIAGDKLLLRTSGRLYCLKQGATLEAGR